MPRTVTLRLEDDVYQFVAEAARAENRTLENLIETAALIRIYEQQFADDSEITEIIADKKLMTRIKTGSAEARAMKGRFVE